MRTDRTSRQYLWTLPSFRRVVWRRYIAQLIRQPGDRSQRTWSALHRRFPNGAPRPREIRTARPLRRAVFVLNCGSWASGARRGRLVRGTIRGTLQRPWYTPEVQVVDFGCGLVV